MPLTAAGTAETLTLEALQTPAPKPAAGAADAHCTPAAGAADAHGTPAAGAADVTARPPHWQAPLTLMPCPPQAPLTLLTMPAAGAADVTPRPLTLQDLITVLVAAGFVQPAAGARAHSPGAAHVVGPPQAPLTMTARRRRRAR